MLELLAPAKINLSLNITGIRSDGYHELETIMQTVALADRLVFKVKERGICVYYAPGLTPAGSDDLVYQAAWLLQEYTGCRIGTYVLIEKHIPVAAGLAGGSADAAATLKGLNQLWDLGLTKAQVLSLGERLGADVPFCLTGGTALARGKGEQIVALPPLPPWGVLLANPSFSVSTAQVYQAYDQRNLKCPPSNIQALVKAVKQKDLKGVAGLLYNALEPVTVSICPEIALIKQELMAKTGALGVNMSGSGPTVFGLYPDLEVAEFAAARFIKQKNYRLKANFTSTYLS
ncbi:MAG: 4-(cytidine 5'-diphospho)-2-C-methyl-D-erythritol kinase [Peptococcaceae bacterium]